jgi:hypothetical protein
MIIISGCLGLTEFREAVHLLHVNPKDFGVW